MNVFDVLREKLTERHKFYQTRFNEMSGTDRDVEDWGSIKSYADAIDIVNQVEQEYSDGWIPCSERLPEEDGAYLVTLYSKYYQQFEVDLLSYNKKYGEWNDIEDRDYSDEVIAWKQLPEPFEKL